MIFQIILDAPFWKLRHPTRSKLRRPRKTRFARMGEGHINESLPDFVRIAIAQDLPNRGYLQTSAKYHRVGRVPPGMTPIEAIRVKHPEMAKHFEEQFHRSMTAQYARCYASGEDKLELTEAEFLAFKRSGGGVA